MESEFLKELSREFEGEVKVNYHLAPPLLPAKLDTRGRPRKRAFGPWIQTPLRMLARLKWLRGTPFDLFGYAAARRAERDLIAWYQALIEVMLVQLDAQRLADLVALAKAPMEIRGYGPVKEAAVHKVKGEVERLMAQLATSRTVSKPVRPTQSPSPFNSATTR